MITDTSKSEGLDIVSVLSGGNAVTELSHKSGNYIHYARLNGQELVIKVRTEQPLIKSDKLINELNLDVHTFSEEL